jgi:hypothetical protein
MGPQGGKKCIIMHVGARKSQKVHYNAVFGGGKTQEKLSTQRKDLRKSREEETKPEQSP